MLKPLFSLSYSLSQQPSLIWSAWQKAEFWQKVWCGKSQLFYLPAISTKITGRLKLQPLLPQYSLHLDKFRDQSELNFSLISSVHSLQLNYSLTGADPVVLNVSVWQLGQSSSFAPIFDTLAKPYLIQHADKLANICRELNPFDSTPPLDYGEDSDSANSKIKSFANYPTIGFFLWHLVNTWQGQVDSALKAFDLTSTQWLLLLNLIKLNETKQEATISSLADRLNLHEVHVSDLVSTLVKKHYVHKLKLANDKRKFHLTATAQGKLTATEANTVMIMTERKYFNSLDSDQRQIFAKFITQLVSYSTNTEH